MSNAGLDEKFVRSQRERLLEVKAEIERMRSGLDADQHERAEDEDDYSEHDSGDVSQSIFNREMDATIEGQADQRLEDVGRALEKIEEGSYGLCDDTGEEIPRGRLEALPEAIRTVEAQQDFERERRPPA